MVARIQAMFAALCLVSLTPACTVAQSTPMGLHGGVVPMIINGTPASLTEWQEVVNIEIQLPNQRTAFCSATIVGAKVLTTAAHCGPNGGTAKFTFKGTTYSGILTRSTLYPDRDHDLAVVITSQPIASANPRTIGGASTRGSSVDILGYGCTTANGTSDGVLRIGQSIISGYSGFYMVTSSPDGAVACRGDSGGPAFVAVNGKKQLVGVNAQSNGSDLTYHTRLDMPESQNFLIDIAKNNGVEICGINGVTCSGGTNPQDPKPSCVLTATPSSVRRGETVSLSLVSTNATSAILDGVSVNVPTAQRQVVTSSLGRISVSAQVQGAGGSGSCSASYEVVDSGQPGDRPTCSLVAIPKEVRPGQAVTLELTANGSATYASIEGTSVAIPVGRMTVTKAATGDYSVAGFVRNGSGSANCFADYRVTNGPVTPPSIPDFAVTPTHCGPNRLPSSGVSTVCLALLKKPDSLDKLSWTQVVQITNGDGTVEVLPILAIQNKGVDAAGLQLQNLVLYTNLTVANQNYRVLDSKTASVALSGTVPRTIEGRSAKGRYFLVDSLVSPSVSSALQKVKN